MPRYKLFLKDDTTRDFFGIVPFVGKAGELEIMVDPHLHYSKGIGTPLPPPALIFAPGEWQHIELQPEKEVKESA